MTPKEKFKIEPHRKQPVRRAARPSLSLPIQRTRCPTHLRHDDPRATARCRHPRRNRLPRLRPRQRPKLLWGHSAQSPARRTRRRGVRRWTMCAPSATPSPRSCPRCARRSRAGRPRRRSTRRPAIPVARRGRAVGRGVTNRGRGRERALARAIIERRGPGGATRGIGTVFGDCLLYTSPSPRDLSTSRMPSSA